MIRTALAWAVITLGALVIVGALWAVIELC